MSEQPPSPRQRRLPQSRRFPSVPMWLWMIAATLLVVWGLSALRPSEAPTTRDPRAAEQPLAEQPVVGPSPHDSQPTTDPLGVSEMGSPAPSEQAVERPQLTPIATDAVALPERYVVQVGDSLSSIASRFALPQEELMALNGISDPNALVAGQELLLPSRFEFAAPALRVLPDSEVVLSPAYQSFDLRAFVEGQGGYLAAHQEKVEGEMLDGVAIVERVSQRYSVGPRLLLALLEHHSGWVSQPAPAERAFALGLRAPGVKEGLFPQLATAAQALNKGYYDRVDGRGVALRFSNGSEAQVPDGTNAGSVAVQSFFAAQGTPQSWSQALSGDGFPATYRRLFGDPWLMEIPELVPAALTQPALELPWASGEEWYFTGGPHGGWVDSSSWAALDFVPPDLTGCYYSDYFVRAAAPGLVIRSENGEVVVDLDGDGFVGTGWTLLYMHMADAVPVGTALAAGEPIGRPSCEGGVSDAAHLHLARRYNGQWMAAGGPVPFTLGGWQAEGTGRPYDGFLVRGDERKEACACRDGATNGLVAP